MRKTIFTLIAFVAAALSVGSCKTNNGATSAADTTVVNNSRFNAEPT